MNVHEISKALKVFKPGQIVEVRAFGKPSLSGYFSDISKLLECVGKYPNDTWYFVMNEIDSACYSKEQRDKIVANPKSATTDKDITRRRWILIDADPRRVSGVSSTDAEKAKAYIVLDAVRKSLKQLGFSDPIRADSGNGYHLLYSVDLPNDAVTADLVKNFLLALDMFFSDGCVGIDTAVYNASRVTKLYGTIAHKGAHTEERPHRESRIIEVPGAIRTTDIYLIQRIADMLPKPEPQTYRHGASFDLQGFIDRHGIGISEITDLPDGVRYRLEECVFDPSHKSPDAAIFQRKNGAIGYKCFHNSCSSRQWRDVRLKFEPDAYSKLPPPGGTGNGSLGNSTVNHYINYTTQLTPRQYFLDFVPFEQSTYLPAFPLDTLPPVTREYVYCSSEMVQAPLEMVGTCVLGTLQIACRGRYPVRLPNGHIERACFYNAPIAPPSERKSGVIDIAVRPLIDFEIEFNRVHDVEVNQSRSTLKLLQGRIAKAEQQAISEKDVLKRQSAEQALQTLNKELAEFEPVEQLRLYGADTTPEKLAEMLKTQGGVFALVSAEGGGLFENIGRYSDKGGLEIYLNGYSGDRICVDRKNSASIVIDRPTLNLIAPCQPSVISDLFSDRQKTGRGLLSRILFVKCVSRVGNRRATGEPLEPRIQTNYHNLCYAMLAATSAGNLEYDDSGFEVYRSFFDEIEPQLTPDVGELSFMADWAGKLHGNMTRFAGLIHCINAFEQGHNPLDARINTDEARAAVELARFYLAHAKAVYAEQAEPQKMTDAKYLWQRLNALNTPEITKSQIYRATQNYRRGVFNLDESLLELDRRGYIRIEMIRKESADKPTTTIIKNELAKQGVFSAFTPASESNYTKYTNYATPVSVPCTSAVTDFAGIVNAVPAQAIDPWRVG